MLRSIFICFLFFSLKSIAQVNVDPDDPNIHYWGRVDFSNPKAPAFEYSGVTIQVVFNGTSIKATIEDFASHGPTTTNYFYKIVDGGSPEKFEALAGVNTYEIAKDLTPDSHTLQIIKLTEAQVGRSAFLGFELDEGSSLQKTDDPDCHIEFIGNSITCGYGNELSIEAPPAGDPGTGFRSVNENNYNAWGYIAARTLGMKYSAVCYSGRGLYRNNTGSANGVMPAIYDRIFPDNPASPLWDSKSNHPDYIVINLGTNDFAPDPADPLNQEQFESAYVDFVKKLKGYHPDATIILSVGVMLSDGYPTGAQQWTRIKTYVQNVVNTLSATMTGVRYFEMSPQSPPYGEDWHPGTATHNAMAASLVKFMHTEKVNCSNITGTQKKKVNSNLIKVYPNMASQEIKIDYSGKDNLDWEIIGQVGQIVQKGNGNTANISRLEPGMYFLMMDDQVVKFVKM